MHSPPPLVHIGYQKTASTFLQKRVFRDEAVFCMPWGEHAAPAIEHFALQHPEKFDPSRVSATFKQDGNLIPVISHEDLAGYPIYGKYYVEVVARRIKETFPGARILICIREQTSMIVSQYFQYIRQGGSRPLTDLLENEKGRVGFRPTIRKEHFEYDLMYQVFRRHFDDRQILMLPYEILAQTPHLYFAKLNTFLGTQLSATLAKGTVNAKPGGAALQLNLFLNKIVPQPISLPDNYRDYPLAKRAQNRLLRNFEKIAGQYTRFGQHFEARVQASAEESLGDYFAASNTRLAALLGDDLTSLGYKTQASNKAQT